MPPRGSPHRGSRPSGFRAVQLLLIIAMGVMVSAAIYTSALIVHMQTALGQVSRYNVTWLASQVGLEVARLEATVAAYCVPGSGVDQDAIQLRLDIVANRINVLHGGEMQQFLADQPALAASVDALARAVDTAQSLVDGIERPGTSGRLLALFSPFDVELARLASAANVMSGDRVAADQREMTRLHWIFSDLLMALAACGLCLVGLLLGRNKLLGRAHRDLHELADSLRRSGAELSAANERSQAAYRELHVQNRMLQERDRDLQVQNARFDAALNNMSQALCMVDAAQNIIVCNNRFLEIFGLSPGVVRQGAPVQDAFRAAAAIGRFPPHLLESVRAEQQILVAESRPLSFFQESGDGQALGVSHQPMLGGGWVATYEDVTERRRVEARIDHMAHHDALTDLPNRVLFRNRLDDELRRLGPRDETLAVLCLDLDHFKDVNDALGHPVGDALLEAVAQRLRGTVRECDTVARLGGDEFAILQIGVAGPADAEHLARRIIEAVNAPYAIEGHRVLIGVSAGIALAPADGSEADHLLKNADMALYRAKAEGRGTYRFFESAMDAQLQARRAIEMDLREALERDQFEVYYQPLLDLERNAIGGVEALLRWRHPEKGMISPAQFIPVAEEIGLIARIGEWVLHRACFDAAGWPGAIKVAVNLSPAQFATGDLVGVVRAALDASGLSPRRLELEITESVLLQNNGAVLQALHELRELGSRISLDDFGTGYSSLSYLRSFPFDKIKIDQCFVREMDQRADCRAIVHSVAMLARQLGMRTTAEGVETAELLEKLRDAGCTEVQGYHIARPQPACQIARMLAAASPHLELAA